MSYKDKMQLLSVSGSRVLQDDSELLYKTLITVMLAAIFAASFHEDVDRTVTRWAPAGSTYPFPAQTRLPAAKLTAAIGGFLIGLFLWSVIGKLRWGAIKYLLQYRDWLRNSKSFKTKVCYYSLKTLLPRKRFLYTFQHVLPKYPLPDLQATCKKMLDVIEPLVTEKEFAVIKKDMEEFEEGEGKKLHSVLKRRYETENNWVADLWDKYAYLVTRSPLYYTNFCNQGGVKKSDISSVDHQSQCSRAACLTYYYMKFYLAIEARTISPLLVNDLIPICTHRYRYVYACTRLPGTAMDEMKLYDGAKHIIVIRKGVMYRVDIVALDVNGEESILSGPELKKIFQDIIDQTHVTGSQWNPSIFTTQNRTLWAKERKQLLAHPVNKASLHDVESAAFHLALEDSSPVGLAAECHSNLCGNGFNRWFDKSLTITVYENGVAGGNVEHTTADATLTSRILEYVWGNCKYKDGEPFTPEAPVHSIVASPKRLEWDLNQFKADFPRYLEGFNTTFRDNVDIHVMEMREGKGAMKKLRVSPDSFMQLALQLAFYRIHKTVPKTYETAMTRFFKYGRTETIRTVSKHSVAFTKAMDDPAVSRSDTIRHLKQAFIYHHNYKLEAMNGQAADRHMFGLYVASTFTGSKPKLFQHKILTDLDQLSTSQSPYFYDKSFSDKMDLYPAGGAFPALTGDGYGVYYLFLGDNFMTVHITSYKNCQATSSKLFAAYLSEAISDMKKLLKK